MNRNRSQADNPGFQFGDHKSLKDFRKSKEQPKFKFNSDIVKDILDKKSNLYNSPNVPQEWDSH